MVLTLLRTIKTFYIGNGLSHGHGKITNEAGATIETTAGISNGVYGNGNGTIENSGTLNNRGDFYNGQEGSGTINNYSGGTINAWNLYNSSYYSNSTGVINNYAGATLTSNGYSYNYSHGIIENSGILNNNRVGSNGGEFSNSGTINNQNEGLLANNNGNFYNGNLN